MSDVTSFLPPDGLIQAVPKIGIVNTTMGYSNQVANLGDPVLNTSGLDGNLKTEIEHLQTAVDSHLGTARNHAAEYFGLRAGLLGVYEDFQHFAGGPLTHSGYGLIYQNIQDGSADHAVRELDFMRGRAKGNLAAVKIALGKVATYNGDIEKDHAAFKQDYKDQKQALSDLTRSVDAIEKQISDMQGSIKANNDKVVKTAEDEGIDLVKNGIILAGEAATENPGAIATGAVMAFNFTKATVTIVVLDVKTIELIKKVATLKKKLNVQENDLQILNNVGSMLSSLTNGGTYSYDTLNTLSGYWDGLQKYIGSLIEDLNNGRAVDLMEPEYVKPAWTSSVADPLKTLLDASSTDTPTQWIWGSPQFKFDSLENLSKYKEAR